MEFTKLSLARGGLYGAGKSSKENETKTENFPMKRKWNSEAPTSVVDLQLKHPLPSDWEQCLDLQSGRMYYVNRKTSRRSWNRPEENKLDLELNMSTGCSSSNNTAYISSTFGGIKESTKRTAHDHDVSNMVALACSNCHILVIICTSSPSCPNCKYVNSLASDQPHIRPSSNY